MFISLSISRGLKFWSVKYASMYGLSELKIFKNIECLGEISTNWPNNLLGINVSKTLQSADNRFRLYYSGLMLLQ